MESIKKFFRRLKVRRSGSALIMTLAILSLLLIMAMVFAFDAQSSTRSASYYANVKRVRMLNQSGINRAIGFISQELGQPSAYPLNPAVRFMEIGAGDWQGFRFLPGRASNGSGFSAGIDSAVGVDFSTDGTRAFTVGIDPLSASTWETNWIAVMSARDHTVDGAATATGDSIIGSISTITLDRTGLLDPSAVVDVTGVTAEGAEIRVGAKVAEIALTSVINATDGAAEFQVQGLGTGKMPTNLPWMSYNQIYRSITLNAAASDSVARYLFPYSMTDAEQYWHDINGDTIATDSEIRDRLDITQISAAGPLDANALYAAFVGESGGNYGQDPLLWSPWLTEVGPASLAEGRLIAARMALMLVDYADTTADDLGWYSSAGIDAATGALTMDVRTPAHVAAGNYEAIAFGVEDGPGLSEVYVYYKHQAPDGVNRTASITFQFEAVNPMSTASYDVKVDVTYNLVVDGLAGVAETKTITLPAASSVVGGPTNKARIWRNDLAAGTFTWGTAGSKLALQAVQIQSIKLSADTGSGVRVLQQWPVNRNGTATSQVDFIYWTTGGPSATDYASYQAQLKVKPGLDVLFDMEDPHNMGNNYWEYLIGTSTEMVELCADDGTDAPEPPDYTYNPTGCEYASAPYGSASVKNAPFERVGEVGRVHSPHTSNRSVRLWAATATDAAGHDGHLLDMFMVGADAGQRGKINLNSGNREVLRALFEGTGIDATTAADALVKSNTANPYKSRGQIADIFYRGGFALDNVADEEMVSDALTKMIELTETRYNYYTIITTARSLRDTGSMNAPGSILYATGRYAIVEAEQKTFATVIRDSWTNAIEILRIDELED